VCTSASEPPRISLSDYSSIGKLITTVAYGTNVYLQEGKSLVQVNTEALELVTYAFGQPWLVNMFPASALFLRSGSPAFFTFSYLARFLPSWFPGLSFPALGRKGKEMLGQIRYKAFGMVKEAMVAYYRLSPCIPLFDNSTYRIVERPTFQLPPNISTIPSLLATIFGMPWH
jgi:hypothetical protein